MFIDYLFPNKLVASYKSDYNQKIEVRTEFGRPRVEVKGMPQSGGIVQDILKKGLDELDSPGNFLLLGLGGGAILHEVRRRWSDCEIIAVEIDPVMIQVARKHFKIKQINGLKVLNEDAWTFVVEKVISNDEKFDAILVDCYVGGDIPSKLEDVRFLEGLKKMMNENGQVVFNRFNTNEVQIMNKKFIYKLMKVFNQVKSKNAYCNMLISVNN